MTSITCMHFLKCPTELVSRHLTLRGWINSLDAQDRSRQSTPVLHIWTDVPLHPKFIIVWVSNSVFLVYLGHHQKTTSTSKPTRSRRTMCHALTTDNTTYSFTSTWKPTEYKSQHPPRMGHVSRDRNPQVVTYLSTHLMRQPQHIIYVIKLCSFSQQKIVPLHQLFCL